MKEMILKEISDLAQKVIEELSEKELKISFAESMTGGLLASSLTKEKSASKILDMSFVVYSDLAKIQNLNVKEETLKVYTPYSKEVIEEMLLGLKTISKADILIAISGLAGPDDFKDHKVGEVWIGIITNTYHKVIKHNFKGNRELIQLQTVRYSFSEVLKNV